MNEVNIRKTESTRAIHNGYLMWPPPLEHSKTDSENKQDNSDGHNNQGKHGLRITYT